MGITGLLKGLSCVSRKQNVSDFRNQSLAIDASSWLHKSVYSVAERYVESTYGGSSAAANLDPVCLRAATRYVSNRCREMLNHAHIARLYLVLDGERCPLKAVTNHAREQKRQENLMAARQYKLRGEYSKAQEKYKSCIKMNDTFASAVARAVEEEFASSHRGAVVCVASPYEADAQLAKLCIDGIADAVVTEDSDVLVYSATSGVAFPILFKLDRNSGNCDVVDMAWLLSPSSSSMLETLDKSSKTTGALVSILRSLCGRESRHAGLGVRLFVQACVLTGCDYAPSQLNGVGLVTAFKLLRDFAHTKCGDRFHKVLKSLKHKKLLVGNENNKNESTSTIMKQYEELLAKSEAVFYHHPVLHMSHHSVIPLTPLPFGLDSENEYAPSMERFDGDLSFLGKLSSKKKKSKQKQRDRVPVEEITIERKVEPPKRKSKSSHTREHRVPEPVINPYAKNKKRNREPLSVDGDEENQRHKNQFAGFQYSEKENHPPKKKSGLESYLVDKKDVRYVKSRFGEDGRKMPSRSIRQKHSIPANKGTWLTTRNSRPSAGVATKKKTVLQRPLQSMARPLKRQRCVDNPRIDAEDQAYTGARDTESRRQPRLKPLPLQQQRPIIFDEDVHEQVRSQPHESQRGSRDRPYPIEHYKKEEFDAGRPSFEGPEAPISYRNDDRSYPSERYKEDDIDEGRPSFEDSDAPITYRIGNSNSDVIDLEEEQPSTKSKYFSARNPRRVTRSPDFSLEVDNFRNTYDEEIQSPERDDPGPAATHTESSPVDDVITFDDDHSNGFYHNESQATAHLPRHDENPFETAGYSVDEDIDETSCQGENSAANYKSHPSASNAHSQRCEFEESIGHNAEVGQRNYKTPFAASQVTGLRSSGIMTKRPRIGSLTNYFPKQTQTQYARRPTSSGSRSFESNSRRKGKGIRIRSSRSIIQRYFKPVVDLCNDDDSF